MFQIVKENIRFLQENIWTGNAMFFLFLVSVVVLTFDRDKSVRRLVWYSILMTVGVAYNYFLFYGVITRIYQEGELVQLRLFWLVPCFLLMSWFLVKLAAAIQRKRRWAAGVVVICSILFIWWAGTPFHPDILVKRSNWYKVSQEAIDSADLILNDMKEHPDHLMERPTVSEITSTDVNDDISPGNAYHYGIRQYTSDFTLTPVWIEPELYEAEGFDVTGYYHNPSQYFICENKMTSVQRTVRQYGYHELARNGVHVLFRYTREATVYLVIRGQTKGDTSGELRGTSGNPSLTTTGWWDILKVGRELQNVKFDYAYASDVGQAKISAGILLRENKNRDSIPAVIPLSGLNDMSWGGYEGYKKKKVIDLFGEEALYNGGERDASYRSPIGAETRFNAAARFRSAMGDTVKRLEEDGKTILVVANPSVSWWLKTAIDRDEMEDLKPGDYVKLQFLDGCWSVVSRGG